MISISDMEKQVEKMNILQLNPILFQDMIIKVFNIKLIHHSNFSTTIPNSHAYFEFNYVIDGEIYTTINGTEFPVGPGDSFLVAKGYNHSHRMHKIPDYTDLCIRFTIEKAPFSDLNTPLYENFIKVFSIPRPYTFDSHIEKLDCVENNLYTSQVVFLNWFFNIYNLWETDIINRTNKSNTLIKNMILQYLIENYRDKFSSKKMAAALNMSYRHLSRIFKQETGVSIVKQLSFIRMEHAKTLLLNSDMTIYDIALQVGFENVYYFSNVFSGYFDMAPAQFRKLETKKEGWPRKYTKKK